MSFLLDSLDNKKEVDKAIRETLDLVLVIRIGKNEDIECMKLDEIVKLHSFYINYFSF